VTIDFRQLQTVSVSFTESLNFYSDRGDPVTLTESELRAELDRKVQIILSGPDWTR